MSDNKDPRLAQTGKFVRGREVIDDSVLLADFERLLEMGEAEERGEWPDDGDFEPLWNSQASSIGMAVSFSGWLTTVQRGIRA